MRCSFIEQCLAADLSVRNEVMQQVSASCRGVCKDA